MPSKVYITHNNDLINTFCKRNAIDPHNYSSYTECTYRCKKFKIGYFVSQYIDFDIETAIILEIVEITSFAERDTLHVICKQAKINKYLKHFAAYVIDVSQTITEISEYRIVPICSFSGPPTTAYKTARALHMIRPKQYY